MLKIKIFILLVAFFALSAFSALSLNAQTPSQNDESTPRSVFYTYQGGVEGKVQGGAGGAGKGGKSGKTGNSNAVIKLPKIKPKPPKIKIVRYKKPSEPGNKKPNGQGDKKPSQRRNPPAPGVEIKVELTRNGVTDFVPLDTIFQTGTDRIKLSIRTNFPAYVAVINRGSSGKLTQLFPCNSGENFIQPFNSFTLPKPFKFAGDPGVDEVLFLLSRQPLPLVNEIANEGLAICQGKSLNSAFQTKMADENLNLEEAGRDLEIADDFNNEGESANYLLLTEQLLKKTVVYTIRLRHQ